MFKTLYKNLDTNAVLISNTSFSFNVFIKGTSRLRPVVGFVEQTKDHSTQTYKRLFKYCLIDTKSKRILIDPNVDKNTNSLIQNTLNSLEKINDTLEMIGVIMIKESEVYVVFRLESVIKYCTLDEVRIHFTETI